MTTTKENVALQPDVETIMRRLRGDATSTPTYRTPVTPSEADQLKAVVKTLETRLKEAHAELAEKNERLSRREKETEETLSNQSKAWREELDAYRQKEKSWSDEQKRLEQEKQRAVSDTSSNNTQLVRLSLTNRQLEEEINALTCERAATIRQLGQEKELVEQQRSELAREKEKATALAETAATKQMTIEKLLETIEHHKITAKTLTESNETLAQQVSLLMQEKGRADTVTKELLAAQMQLTSLAAQLEAANSANTAAQEKAREALKEKEITDVRIKEVEELLIAKLEAIAELEEEIGTVSSQAEDLQLQLSTAEQEGDRLAKELQQSGELNRGLTEKLTKLGAELTDARKRAEMCDRLKKSATEAVAHAHSIMNLLELTPSRQPHCDAKGCEPSLFEEPRSAYDLF